jgi:cell wall-associated NlpC family hydrolase
MQAVSRSKSESPRAVIRSLAASELAGQQVVDEARKYLGVPYVWGGASPSGFDCSGLTLYVYAKFGVQFSHGATVQAAAGEPVTDLRPGDLVFFGGSGYYHHVAIYAGHGQMIHAPHSGTVVQVAPLRPYQAARRYRLDLKTSGPSWPD